MRQHRWLIACLVIGLLAIPCCVSVSLCSTSVIGWLCRIAISSVRPREPWPLAGNPVWKADLDDVIALAPVVVDGQAYVETHSGLVILDAQTGIAEWEGRLDLRNPNPSLAAGSGFVAVGSPHGVLVLQSDTGEKVWHYDSLIGFPVSLIIDQDRLYASFAFEEVRAFALSSGELVWRSTEPGRQHYAPYLVLAGTHLIVVQAAGRVYALDTQSGQTEWESHLNDVLHRSALVDTEQVVVNGDRAIYSIRVTDGRVQWETPSEGQSVGSPLVVNDQVFWVTRNGEVQSASVRDGDSMWTASTGAEIVCSLLASDGQTLWVRVSYPKSALLVYDIETGQELAEYSVDTPLYQYFQEGIGPVMNNGRLYLASGARIAVYDAQP
jgi:outer membrane protein assembly factor BamB